MKQNDVTNMPHSRPHHKDLTPAVSKDSTEDKGYNLPPRSLWKSSKMGVQEERSRGLTLGLEELVGRFCDTVSSQGKLETVPGLAAQPPIQPGQSLSESEGHCVYNCDVMSNTRTKAFPSTISQLFQAPTSLGEEGLRDKDLQRIPCCSRQTSTECVKHS